MGFRVDGHQILFFHPRLYAAAHLLALGKGGTQGDCPQHLHDAGQPRNGGGVGTDDNIAAAAVAQKIGHKCVQHTVGMVCIDIGAGAFGLLQYGLVCKALAIYQLYKQKDQGLGDEAIENEADHAPEKIGMDVFEIFPQGLGFYVIVGKIVVQRIPVINYFFVHALPSVCRMVSRSMASILSMHIF